MSGKKELIGLDPGRHVTTRPSRGTFLTIAQVAGLDDRTIEFIRCKALRLGGRGAFACQDAQDLRQEMLLECWTKSALFNPTKSSCRTFFNRVANNRIASLAEAQMAHRRDYRLCQRSLSDPVACARNGVM